MRKGLSLRYLRRVQNCYLHLKVLFVIPLSSNYFVWAKALAWAKYIFNFTGGISWSFL